MSLRSLALLSLCVVLTACSKINQENYSKLKTGMSKAEVEQLLGTPAECSGALGMSSCTWGRKELHQRAVCGGQSPYLFRAGSQMKRLHLLLAFCAVVVLGGCATSATDPLVPKTAGNIDLKRYEGKWFELARLPMLFQRDCAQSEAHYNLRPDGTMGVLNRCRMFDGEWLRAEGSAWPQEPGHNDRLWVEFNNWFTKLVPGVAKGEYWVLYVDERYRTAIVGSPDRKYLWLLANPDPAGGGARKPAGQGASARL